MGPAALLVLVLLLSGGSEARRTAGKGPAGRGPPGVGISGGSWRLAGEPRAAGGAPPRFQPPAPAASPGGVPALVPPPLPEPGAAPRQVPGGAWRSRACGLCHGDLCAPGGAAAPSGLLSVHCRGAPYRAGHAPLR